MSPMPRTSFAQAAAILVLTACATGPSTGNADSVEANGAAAEVAPEDPSRPRYEPRVNRLRTDRPAGRKVTGAALAAKLASTVTVHGKSATYRQVMDGSLPKLKPLSTAAGVPLIEEIEEFDDTDGHSVLILRRTLSLPAEKVRALSLSQKKTLGVSLFSDAAITVSSLEQSLSHAPIEDRTETLAELARLAGRSQSEFLASLTSGADVTVEEAVAYTRAIAPSRALSAIRPVSLEPAGYGRPVTSAAQPNNPSLGSSLVSGSYATAHEFVLGATYGYEMPEFEEKGRMGCLWGRCAARWHFVVNAGAGVGLRVPVRVRASQTPVSVQSNVATPPTQSSTVTSTFETLDGDDSYYRRAGIKSTQTFGGKELVLEAGVELSASVKLMGHQLVPSGWRHNAYTLIDQSKNFVPHVGQGNSNQLGKVTIPGSLMGTAYDDGAVAFGADLEITVGLSNARLRGTLTPIVNGASLTGQSDPIGSPSTFWVPAPTFSQGTSSFGYSVSGLRYDTDIFAQGGVVFFLEATGIGRLDWTWRPSFARLHVPGFSLTAHDGTRERDGALPGTYSRDAEPTGNVRGYVFAEGGDVPHGTLIQIRCASQSAAYAQKDMYAVRAIGEMQPYWHRVDYGNAADQNAGRADQAPFDMNCAPNSLVTISCLAPNGYEVSDIGLHGIPEGDRNRLTRAQNTSSRKVEEGLSPTTGATVFPFCVVSPE